eukprot:TRINITY_DN3911_c0_g1_i2.p1 TRINITY_DN3911_c0_g1~~TRINITY_DN3911_c0_g1_i2.p1  ORF type:complete len:540 (+),score=92.97 TRINITY_DN3911_c0_g1_i2:3-1622(+)
MLKDWVCMSSARSRLAALKQSLIDGITNSAGQGFRLEGFDGRPASLTSYDKLLKTAVMGQEKLVKKALRLMLQRMTAAQILLFFLDLNADLPHPGARELQTTLSQPETAELVLHELATKLARLSVACHRSPAPQKWIGSSVALAFDAGRLPDRRKPEEEIRKQAVVSIFDWGRSALNTIERHNRLSDDERRDRVKYWEYYCGGIYRLSWEVARCYYHRFCNADSWSTVTFILEDFDLMSSSDFMCKTEVPVKTTEETTVELPINVRLLRLADGVCHAESALRGVRPSLTYSIRWQEYPASSRLMGAWQVTLIRACNLPREDLLALEVQSDPLVKVIAMSENGHCFRQDSSVKQRTRCPEWNEVFELPVARSSHGLRDALASADLNCPEDLLEMFPPEKPSEEMVHPADEDGLTGNIARSASALSLKARSTVNLLTHWEDGHKSQVDEALETWESLIETAVASDQKASATASTVQVTEPIAEKSASVSLTEFTEEQVLDEGLALGSRSPQVEVLNKIEGTAVMGSDCRAGCSDATACRIT